MQLRGANMSGRRRRHASRKPAAPPELGAAPAASFPNSHAPVRRRCRRDSAPIGRPAGPQWQSLIAAWALVACWLQPMPAHAAERISEAVQRVATNYGPIGASSQTLLPPLSTFGLPGGYLGAENVSLGNTTFRYAAAQCCVLCKTRHARLVVGGLTSLCAGTGTFQFVAVLASCPQMVYHGKVG